MDCSALLAALPSLYNERHARLCRKYHDTASRSRLSVFLLDSYETVPLIDCRWQGHQLVETGGERSSQLGAPSVPTFGDRKEHDE